MNYELVFLMKLDILCKCSLSGEEDQHVDIREFGRGKRLHK